MDIKNKVRNRYLFGDTNSIDGVIFKVSISNNNIKFSTYDVMLNRKDDDTIDTYIDSKDKEVLSRSTKIPWSWGTKSNLNDKYFKISTAKYIPIPGVIDTKNAIKFKIVFGNKIESVNGSTKKDTEMHHTSTIESECKTMIVSDKTFYILVLFTANNSVPVVKIKNHKVFNLEDPFDNENALIYNSLNESVDKTLTETTVNKRYVKCNQQNMSTTINTLQGLMNNENVEYDDNGEVIRYSNFATGISYLKEDKDNITRYTWRLGEDIIDRYTVYKTGRGYITVRDKYNVFGISNMDLLTGERDTNSYDISEYPYIEAEIAKEVDRINSKIGKYEWKNGDKTIVTQNTTDYLRTDIINGIVISNSNDHGISHFNISLPADSVNKDESSNFDVINSTSKIDIMMTSGTSTTEYNDISGINYSMVTSLYNKDNSNQNTIISYSDNFVTFKIDQVTGEVELFSSYIYNKNDIYGKGIYTRDAYGVPQLFKLNRKELK